MNLDLFQDIFLDAGVVIGGFWTILTFLRLKEQKRAREEEELLQRKLYCEAVVEVKIEANKVLMPNDSGTYISILVKLANLGKHRTQIYYKDIQCAVKQITFDNKNGFTVAKEFVATILPDNCYGIDLMVKYTHRLYLMAKVDGPGIYFIQFSSQMSQEEWNTRKLAGGLDKVLTPGVTMSWDGKTILVID